MSVRSYICIEFDNGKILGCYCHNDGYLTHNGAILIDHYNKRSKVEKLILNGDMSCLKQNLEPNENLIHNFSKRQEDVCVFYKRDRKEVNVDFKVVDLNKLNEDSLIDYIYIFDKDDIWRYFKVGKLEKGLKRVDDALENIFIELGFNRPYDVYGIFTKSDIAYYG